MTKNKKYSSTAFGWLSFSMCSLFLIYEFTTRIMPSVLATRLLVTFHLTATELGFLSAITSYVYIVLQIPAAILITRIDFRFILVISFLLTALATLWFGEANSLARLDVARAVLGVASASAWVGMFKAGKFYLPARLFPQVSGNIAFLAIISSAIGGIVLAGLFSLFWWPNVIVYFALLGFILALVMGLFFMKTSRQQVKLTPDFELSEFENIIILLLKNWRTYILCLLSFLSFVPVGGFALLWGISFFQSTYHIHTVFATIINSSLLIGLAIGSPFIGYILSRFPHPKTAIIIGSILTLVCLSIVIYIDIPIWLSFILSFIAGIGSSTGVHIYTISEKQYQAHHLSLMVAILNIMSIISVAVSQPLIGHFLDQYHLKFHHVLEQVYTTSDFRHAFIIIIIALLATLFFSFFLPNKIKVQT